MSCVYMDRTNSLQDTADGIRAIRVGNARGTEAFLAEADGTFVMRVSVTFSFALVTLERTWNRSWWGVSRGCFSSLSVRGSAAGSAHQNQAQRKKPKMAKHSSCGFPLPLCSRASAVRADVGSKPSKLSSGLFPLPFR